MTDRHAVRPYHHGDLREALVAAAERLVSDRSGWTFTLREVARAAGVSHNAPYNHFADRRALLAAIAARGFDDLADAMRQDAREDAGGVAMALRRAAQAYVAFAVAHPARFRLMFSAELANYEDVAFRAAGERAFAVLHALIVQGVAEGRLQADPHGTHALTAWSLVHGLSTLMIDGKVPAGGSEQAAADLSGAIADTLFFGLATHATTQA